MKFDPPLNPATFVKRYKRFLVDMMLPSGEVITGHCPNTGSMKNCLAPDSPCWYSLSDNPKRKYPMTWEIATTPNGFLAGINTGRANNLVKEAIELGTISELSGYDTLKAEVKYGEENSRIDFLLTKEGAPDCYVEVKSVTLDMGQGEGQFPDAVSTRGAKHLRELAIMAESGQRAVLLFCVQHTGIDFVRPADEIDPEYGRQLRLAMEAGVEVIAYNASISADEIVLTHSLPVVTD